MVEQAMGLDAVSPLAEGVSCLQSQTWKNCLRDPPQFPLSLHVLLSCRA